MVGFLVGFVFHGFVDWLCPLGVRASWAGHAALNELGVAYFALYLMHDRVGSTSKVYQPKVLGPCLLSRLGLVG
ncbi:hypothetical protein [Nonomuraea sp. NPDC049709]|uniref:hypothetical protein n=1 Tax=Nonomuraea sp. NPDC049709 TaxID=3154736 RepID=UPI003448142F